MQISKKMLLTGIAIKGVKDVMKPSPLKGDWGE